MTTITLDSKQLHDKTLHFGDLKEMLKFLTDEGHITEWWKVEDNLSPDTHTQLNDNLALERSTYVDITYLK